MDARIITYGTVCMVLDRYTPEHRGHSVRVWWRMRSRPYVALVCGCGRHVDLPLAEFRVEHTPLR